MTILEEIAEVTGDFKECFIERFHKTLLSEEPLISKALQKVKHTQGKHIRPLLMALTIQLKGKAITVEAVDNAVLLELLHSASLLHDDVIDLSPFRRGEPTLNAIYGNHISVLVGDFILARCFHYAVTHCQKKILQVVAEAGMLLTMGEISQLEASDRNKAISEEDYFRIIQRKTAALFEAATHIGAIFAEASPKEKMLLSKLGRNIGNAFQIKDDLFDYYEEAQTGKPSGLDLAEGKVTLPLIYVYQKSTLSQQKRINQLIAEAVTQEESRSELIQMAFNEGGIDATRDKLKSILEEARAIISLFPASLTQEALFKLCDFLYTRSF